MISELPGRVRQLSVLSWNNEALSAANDSVAVEEPLEIQISHVREGRRVIRNLSVTMRTPGHDTELAAGFLISEGLLENRDQIDGVETIDENRVRVVFRDHVRLDLQSLERHFYTTSSCGVCGKTSLEALAVSDRIRLASGVPILPPEILLQLPDRLRAAQPVFDRTGGLHAAGLFDVSGHLLALHEDVGRHNAVDKLIGAEWLAGRADFSQCVLFVSGRTSFELMQKTLMAGIPILASVGAPSSLAVDLGRRFGATLVGFVRGSRFNLYSGAERIPEMFNSPTHAVIV